MIDKADFRRVMGCFATGVVVATTRDAEGERVGITCNSVTSVSLDPPLVLFCVDQKASSHEAFATSGHFALSILREDDESLSRKFASAGTVDRFLEVETREVATGSPILTSALAWIDCAVWKTVEAGDHTIFIGEVRALGAAPGGDPLLYLQGRYRSLTP